VEVEKSLALKIKKNEMLAFELSSCHSSITSLKSLNGDLNARIEKLNIASPSVERVSICANCKDHDFNVCSNHASTIAKLNDEIAQLNVQLKTWKNEVEKLNFLGMPSPLVDIPPLMMDMVSKREPRTLRAKRSSTSQRRRGRHLCK
jgi:Leucine-rich repeat (LRR) protein